MNEDSGVMVGKGVAGYSHFKGGVSDNGAAFEYRMSSDFGGKRRESVAIFTEDGLFIQQGGQVVELTPQQAEYLASAVSRCMPRVRARLEVA